MTKLILSTTNLIEFEESFLNNEKYCTIQVYKALTDLPKKTFNLCQYHSRQKKWTKVQRCERTFPFLFKMAPTKQHTKTEP
jgi:hypothetical protein